MKKTTCLIFAAAAALLAGCQNTVNTVENQEKVMRRNLIVSKNISTDSFLRDRLAVDSINKATLPSGLMQVQVTLRSKRTGFWSEMWSGITGENPYKIAYRFNWLDQNGMEVKTATSVWKEMDMIPGETIRVQSIAPNPQCNDFMLSLKEYDYK